MFWKGKKRHSSSSSQSNEINTKSKFVDSSLGGLSPPSTVASVDTDSTKSSGQSNNSDTCAEFQIKYFGLRLSERKCLEGPLDLINYIDVFFKKLLNYFTLWLYHFIFPSACMCDERWVFTLLKNL
uniref:Uncharacterized protein n=1 Tax=Propithecus coquereli TaxID=379532 RepID=A0A2K6G8A4_PROCO